MLDELAIHIAHLISHARNHNFKRIECTAEGEQAWVETILNKGTGGGLGDESCTPGYYNNEGQVAATFAQAVPYGEGPVAFFELLQRWRAAGDFDGVEFS